MPGQWQPKIFTDMERHQARDLLGWIVQAKKGSEFLKIEFNFSIFGLSPQGSSLGDHRLLQVFLYRGQPNALVQATQSNSLTLHNRFIPNSLAVVQEWKKKSGASKEPSDRIHFAKSAFYYAVASGDLNLYTDVLTWSRRYIRDPVG